MSEMKSGVTVVRHNAGIVENQGLPIFVDICNNGDGGVQLTFNFWERRVEVSTFSHTEGTNQVRCQCGRWRLFSPSVSSGSLDDWTITSLVCAVMRDMGLDPMSLIDWYEESE